MADKGLKLLGMWASGFALRVEWALKLKGLEYEYQNEDLPFNKSDELLHHNPVAKKVPVLVHDGRAIAESIIIVEYIDETWKDGYYPIMPEDPYERARARFWAKFADDKMPAAFFAFLGADMAQEQQQALQELQTNLKILEEALEGKKFFGGESIGFLDIVAGWLSHWLPMLEKLSGLRVVDAESLPLFTAWTRRFLEVEVIKKSLPPKDKLYEFNKSRREEFLSGKLHPCFDFSGLSSTAVMDNRMIN